MTPQPTQEQLEAIKSLLNQFIVFGQKQQPFNCARCGAGSDDKEKDFCWCTDRDSSSTASSPTWIDNVNYPRFVEAEGKAISAITALIQEAVKGELEEVYSERQLVHDSVVTPMDWIIRPHKINDRIKQLSGGSNNE